MKNPFGKKKAEVAAPQEPRLAGHSEPFYDPAAKDALKEVALRVFNARRPPGNGEGSTDSVTELKRAIQAADLYCNAELTTRMDALWEAAVEESMGGPTEATTTALRHFTLGCLMALGMND